MENRAFKFKTNLNCGGCVSKVQSDLDVSAGVGNWQVDIEDVDKILTVKSQDVTEEEIVELVQRKGFKAERLT